MNEITKLFPRQFTTQQHFYQLFWKRRPGVEKLSSMSRKTTKRNFRKRPTQKNSIWLWVPISVCSFKRHLKVEIASLSFLKEGRKVSVLGNNKRERAVLPSTITLSLYLRVESNLKKKKNFRILVTFVELSKVIESLVQRNATNNNAIRQLFLLKFVLFHSFFDSGQKIKKFVLTTFTVNFL